MAEIENIKKTIEALKRNKYLVVAGENEAVKNIEEMIEEVNNNG